MRDDSAFYAWLQTYDEPHPSPKTMAKAAWFAALAPSTRDVVLDAFAEKLVVAIKARDFRDEWTPWSVQQSCSEMVHEVLAEFVAPVATAGCTCVDGDPLSFNPKCPVHAPVATGETGQRELIAKWRTSDYDEYRLTGHRECADELEATLAAQPAGTPQPTFDIHNDPAYQGFSKAIAAHIKDYPSLGDCEWNCITAAPLLDLLKKVKERALQAVKRSMNVQDARDAVVRRDVLEAVEAAFAEKK